MAEMRLRAEVLRRIRTANGGASDGATARVEWEGLARGYRRAGYAWAGGWCWSCWRIGCRTMTRGGVGRAGGCGASVAGMLAARGKRRMVVPAGLPAEWLPAGFEFVVDDGLPAVELDGVDGVVTGSTVAIAETGTVVLQNVRGAGKAGGYAGAGLSPVPGASGGCGGDGA